MIPPASLLRGGVRAVMILRACGVGFIRYMTTILWRRKTRNQLALARWSQQVALDLLDVMELEIEVRGSPPANGMLACNHLSYLDIIVLAAITPSTFISKHQVKYWPVFGWFGMLAGTLFLRRERRSHVVELSRQLKRVVASGSVLTLFPEGTSTDGSHVKPFHSTLFQPAAEYGWPVTPGWISYGLAGGPPEREICFFGSMLFLPHFLKLLCREGPSARVVFGEPLPCGLDRKAIATGLHRQVCRLAAENSGCELRANPQVESNDLSLEPALLSPE